MIVAISGVPGTGKSRVASVIAKRLNASVVSITVLLEAGKIPYTLDRTRKTKIVTAKAVQRAVDRVTARGGDFVIEGHLAHLLKTDVLFILRCDPKVLRKRLRARRWPKAKVEENVQAELLDAITSETVRRKTKTYEIDTTKRSPNDTATIISKILKSATYARKFKPGRIKWLTAAAL